MPAININMYIPTTQPIVPLKSYNFLSANPTFAELPQSQSNVSDNTTATAPYYFMADSTFVCDGNGAVLIPQNGSVTTWYRFNNSLNVWQDVTGNWTVSNDINTYTNSPQALNFILTGTYTIDNVVYNVYSFYAKNGRGTPIQGSFYMSFDIT